MAPPANPPYLVTINNKTGQSQSYGVFALAPIIKHGGGSEVKVTTRIINSVDNVPTGNGQAVFVLSKTYYATCGIYDIESRQSSGDRNKAGSGSGREIIDQRPVTLGYEHGLDGVVTGTSLEVDCENGTPSFVTTQVKVSDPPVGFFGVRTRSDFTSQIATANKFVLGFTSSLRHSIGSYASWTPQPAQLYLVKPSATFYVAVGSFQPNDLVKASLSKEESTCVVEFDKMATDQINLIHQEDGHLRVATEADIKLMGIPEDAMMVAQHAPSHLLLPAFGPKMDEESENLNGETQVTVRIEG